MVRFKQDCPILSGLWGKLHNRPFDLAVIVIGLHFLDMAKNPPPARGLE